MFTVSGYTAAMFRPSTPLLIAGIIGLVLWTATAIVGGTREPWDSGLYWSLSYPAALGLSAALGFIFPHGAWRWAAMLVCSQLIIMLLAGSGLGLLPLGLIMLAVLSLPAIALAEIAAAVQRRLQR
jgi:hypothetical protein